QTITSINLASTYIAIGWSDTAPTMNNMDVAMFFPGTQIVQDRFYHSYTSYNFQLCLLNKTCSTITTTIFDLVLLFVTTSVL
ncbi:unnamed protein product, partial [Rotaria sordida]